MRYFVCIAVLLGTWLVACAQTETNWSHRIVSKERRAIKYWIMPCGDVINELVIDGKRFDNVRGLNKFYLQVPNTNAIVFVTNEKNYSVVYHVYNMDTGDDVAIPAETSDFGYSIGSERPRDSVELAGDGEIILCHFDSGAKSTLPQLAELDSVKSLYYLDTRKKTIVSRKTLYYDSKGKLISESIWSPSPK